MTASHLQFQFIEIESADAMGWFRLVKKNASNVRERIKTIRKTYLFLSIQITGIFHFSPIEQQYFDYFLFI